MSSTGSTNSIVYECLFCSEGIAPSSLDPCALQVIARIDCPRQDQKQQMFYCHLACLQAHAPAHAASFFINDPDFPTIGELDEE